MYRFNGISDASTNKEFFQFSILWSSFIQHLYKTWKNMESINV